MLATLTEADTEPKMKKGCRREAQRQAKCRAIGKELAKLRVRHLAQAGLRLLGQAGENHGNMIAGMLIAGAGNDDPITMDSTFFTRRLQHQCHLRPGRKGRGTAKFDAIFVNNHRVR